MKYSIYFDGMIVIDAEHEDDAEAKFKTLINTQNVFPSSEICIQMILDENDSLNS